MPLLAGKSNMGHNIAELIKAGHPQRQAVAIAYKKAGEDGVPNPGMGAGIMFLTPENKALFLRRKGADDPNSGQWCLPGGMADDGETPEDTAVRETFEETGGIPHGPRHLVYRTKTPSGKDWNTFAQQVPAEFEPKLSDEHSEHGWHSLDQPPEPLEAGTRAMLDALAQDDDGQAQDEKLALDRASATNRTYDANGYLHVADTHISKANVCGYLGREINKVMDGEPGWVSLEPDRMYQLFRDPDELKKGAATFNNVPLLNVHMPATAKQFPKDNVIGSTGTDSVFADPYLDNSLVIWNGGDIKDVENDVRKELSSAYRYRADMTPGAHRGIKYDGVMRDIVGNHVALVKEGRAGSDVVVGDAALPKLEETFEMNKTVLSRKATMVQGMLAGYLLPKLATDAKIDLAPTLAGVSAKNFKDKKAGIIEAVTKLVAGKLATDAAITDLPKVMDAMQDMDVVEGADVDPNSGLPMNEEEMRKKTMDADPVAGIQALLKGKVDDATIARVCEMIKGGAAMDAETPEEKEAKEKKAAEDRRAHDAALVKDMVTKPDLEKAIKVATDAATQRQKDIRDAENEVRPYVGTLAVACDSAEEVYRQSILVMGNGRYAMDEIKELPLTALKVIAKSIRQAGRQEEPRVALDSAGAKSFAERFPDAAKIRVAG